MTLDITLNYIKQFLVYSLSIISVIFIFALLYCYCNYVVYYSFLIFPSTLIKLNSNILPTQKVSWLQIEESTKFDSLNSFNSKRPNIILIVADDLGINDLSRGLGVSTPHIDSLYENGINFVNAYAGHATW